MRQESFAEQAQEVLAPMCRDVGRVGADPGVGPGADAGVCPYRAAILI